MEDLKYEPIGKAKMTTEKYWRMRAKASERASKVMAIAMFALGAVCGGFIGIYG